MDDQRKATIRRLLTGLANGVAVTSGRHGACPTQMLERLIDEALAGIVHVADVVDTKWNLQVKGWREGDYEIAAIKADNDFGRQSWGWGGLDKVIIFSSGLGGNQLNPGTAEQWNEALRLAAAAVTAFNAMPAEPMPPSPAPAE